MKRIINFQHRFLAWKCDVIILAFQSGILALLFSVLYVLLAPHNIALIWAMIGVFVTALVQTVGIKDSLANRIRAGLVFAFSAGIATAFGCYCGNSFLATSIVLLVIVPFVGLTSGAQQLSAAIVLFTVDLFVVSSGLPVSFSLALVYGVAFVFGGLSLIITVVVCSKIFPQSFSSDYKYRFSITHALVTYKQDIGFAIILTIAVLIANTISFIFKMPQGFWIPMTVLLILKSDHDFTKSRINHRLFGTMLGSILAIAVALVFISKIAMALLMFPLLFFIVVSMAKHYGAYTLVLTIMVTVIINLIEPSGYLIAEHRLIDTIIGVIIVATVLWVLKPMCLKFIQFMRKIV